MDAQSIAALRADLGEAEGLWPEHVEILAAFYACDTQWRVASVSDGLKTRVIWLGLDYTASRVALELSGFELTPELWDGLREMERLAAAALNEPRP